MSGSYSIHVLIFRVTMTKIILFKFDCFDIVNLDLLYYLHHLLHPFNNLSGSLRYLFSACKITRNKIWREYQEKNNCENSGMLKQSFCPSYLWIISQVFKNITLKYCDHASVKKWTSRSLEILFSLSFYVHFYPRSVIFISSCLMELVLSGCSDVFRQSYSHFQEQQRQVCSLREG